MASRPARRKRKGGVRRAGAPGLPCAGGGAWLRLNFLLP